MINLDELNQNVVGLKPSGIRKFFDLASTMEGVISLGVGEPDFETPYHIREAGMYAIEKGRTFYTANLGLLELRKEVCNYNKRRLNLEYDYKTECLITVGGSEGIDIVMRTILKPGDEVIVLTPGYVAYEPSIALNSAICVPIELKEENQFKLTSQALEAAITDKTKAIMMNYPSNPTGGIMTKEDYDLIVPIIKEHGLYVISDEIYAELTYDSIKHYSIASYEEIKEKVIVISGFSKAFSMTGWRLGYILANSELIKIFNKIHQYTIMCPTTISQYAGIEAMKHGDEDIAYMRDSFETRRNFIVNRLNQIGLKCHMPKGAFYVFPSIKSTGLTSQAFCAKLLDEEKVACVPGDAFGEAGEGYVRISYAYSLEEIKEALNRIEKFMKAYNKNLE